MKCKIRCGWTDPYKTIVKFILHSIYMCNIEKISLRASELLKILTDYGLQMDAECLSNDKVTLFNFFKTLIT